MYARYALGNSSYWMGEFLPAREQLEMAIALYDPERHRPLASRYEGVDAGVLSLSYAAWTLWPLGYPDSALKRGDEALALAERLSHPLSLGFALNFVSTLRQFRREAGAAQKTAESLTTLSLEHGYSDFLAWATILRGCAMAAQKHSEEGIAQIQEGMAALRATGFELARPRFLCSLAEACMEAGRLDDALDALTEALAAADQREERQAEAEIHRLKGELLLQAKPTPKKREIALSERSRSRASRAQSRSNCVRPSASRGCLHRRAVATRRARCSPKSTAGSPKASTPPT